MKKVFCIMVLSVFVLAMGFARSTSNDNSATLNLSLNIGNENDFIKVGFTNENLSTNPVNPSDTYDSVTGGEMKPWTDGNAYLEGVYIYAQVRGKGAYDIKLSSAGLSDTEDNKEETISLTIGEANTDNFHASTKDWIASTPTSEGALATTIEAESDGSYRTAAWAAPLYVKGDLLTSPITASEFTGSITVTISTHNT